MENILEYMADRIYPEFDDPFKNLSIHQRSVFGDWMAGKYPCMEDVDPERWEDLPWARSADRMYGSAAYAYARGFYQAQMHRVLGGLSVDGRMETEGPVILDKISKLCDLGLNLQETQEKCDLCVEEL